MTLGIAFIIADICLWIWTGDPRLGADAEPCRASCACSDLVFPIYRLVVIAVASRLGRGTLVSAGRDALGAMIRASVDDRRWRAASASRSSRLFTVVFCLGAALAGVGWRARPRRSCRSIPASTTDMLPLALVVVILGGVGSLLGAFVGSFDHRLHLQLSARRCSRISPMSSCSCRWCWSCHCGRRPVRKGQRHLMRAPTSTSLRG